MPVHRSHRRDRTRREHRVSATLRGRSRAGSSNPPKPGNQLPASLTPAPRLTIDSSRSPPIPPSTTARPVAQVSDPKPSSTAGPISAAPSAPASVLFGDRLESFRASGPRRPMDRPAMKAPISANDTAAMIGSRSCPSDAHSASGIPSHSKANAACELRSHPSWPAPRNKPNAITTTIATISAAPTFAPPVSQPTAGSATTPAMTATPVGMSRRASRTYSAAQIAAAARANTADPRVPNAAQMVTIGANTSHDNQRRRYSRSPLRTTAPPVVPNTAARGPSEVSASVIVTPDRARDRQVTTGEVTTGQPEPHQSRDRATSSDDPSERDEPPGRDGQHR